MPLRSRRRPRWAIGAIGGGALWMLIGACQYLTGYTATATVTGEHGHGVCDVVWEDPSGSALSGQAECSDPPPGTRLEVRVTGWPVAGEPVLPGTYVVVALAVGLPLVAAGAARLRHLRRWGPAVPVAHLATPEALPDGRHAASVDGTGAALTRSARRAGALLGLAALAASAAAILLVEADRADRGLRDTGVTTVGTVLRVDPDRGVGDGGASVEFTAGGTSRARYVWLGDVAYDYVEGQLVDVVYDRADPDRFAIDDVGYGSGATYWPWVVAGVAAVTAGPVGISLLGTHRRIRRLLRSRAWTSTQVRVEVGSGDRLLFTGPDGEVWRADRNAEWPVIDRPPPDRGGWGLPAEDADDQPHRQSAWWVCDGIRAVFSPDRGAPLVLARRVGRRAPASVRDVSSTRGAASGK